MAGSWSSIRRDPVLDDGKSQPVLTDFQIKMGKIRQNVEGLATIDDLKQECWPLPSGFKTA